MIEIVLGVIAIALAFDFLNGFHDSANSIATIVGTRVLRPLQAVTLASVANLAGPFVFGVAVASTVGKGIIHIEIVTVSVISAALAGGIVWDIITWYFGIPSSSSHALIGGLIGAGVAAGGLNAIIADGVTKVILFMVISPALGLIATFFLVVVILHVFQNHNTSRMNRYFGKVQLLSSAFFSLTHGTNDGQKTMGVIAVLLFTSNLIDHFYVPYYVIISAAAAISLGTFFGGWRIVRTMAFRLTALKPYQGFSAETMGGVVLSFMANFGIPVSTTHAISGAIMGAGATRRLSAVRWGVGLRVVWAWVITIPASATIGWLTYLLLLRI